MNLIITLDFGKLPDWVIKAKSMQINAWVEANRDKLPFENMILIPAPGESKVYWLEGKVDDPSDIKTLDEIRDRLKPILEAALKVKVDQSGYVNPIQQGMDELKEHRKRLALKKPK